MAVGHGGRYLCGRRDEDGDGDGDGDTLNFSPARRIQRGGVGRRARWAG